MNKQRRWFLLLALAIFIAPVIILKEAEAGGFRPSVIWNDSGTNGVLVASPTELILLSSKGERMGTFNIAGPFNNMQLSSNGKRLAYSTSEGVFLTNLDTKETRQLAKGYGNYLHWSPDSTSLIFAIDKYETAGQIMTWQSQALFKSDADGKNIEQVYP